MFYMAANVYTGYIAENTCHFSHKVINTCWGGGGRVRERFAHNYYVRSLTIRKINFMSSEGIYIQDPGLYTRREWSLLPSKLNSCYNRVSDKLGVFLARAVSVNFYYIQKRIFHLQTL
jgi:hypothetical protein